MKNIIAHLSFAGNCREALNFYKECFKGEIVSSQTFEEAKMKTTAEYKQKIIHAEFKAEGVNFMAADGMPDFVIKPGNNVSLTVNLTDEAEQEKIFKALSIGGTVTMPLGKTFWGATFGMLTDRYGVNWMLNCGGM
jgi:PhnB protein